MKRILIALAAAALLAGCGMFETRPLPRAKESTEAPAIAAARLAVDESYAQLIALNRTIAANVEAKAWTSAHAQRWLDASKQAREKVDKVRDALKAGTLTSGELKPELVRAAIIELQRRIVAGLPPE